MRQLPPWGMLLVVVLASSCGGNPPAVPAPVTRSAFLPGTGEERPSTEPACAVLGANSPACLAAAPNPARHDSAARAFAAGLMALRSAGVTRFAADHPQWDGRGVLIAILDSGIDPGIPGLGTTSDGAHKIVDLRDFSGEGRIDLQRIARRGDTIFLGKRILRGASRVAALAGETQLWGGTFAELPLGRAPAADVNGNGTVGDTLLVVVARTTSGWALLADTDGDGTLANERPIHDYLVAHEIFGWHAPDHAANGTAAPVYFAANLADSAGVPILDLYFDTSDHGSHVSGIAAGHDIYGVTGFDGVAPGAKLLGVKIGNNASGGVSVSGSMLRGLEYALRIARERSMRLVVNLSFGVGNEIAGTARIDALLDSVLTANPGVVMTVAAGNDGPGLATLGFPASASRVLSVGATLPVVFSGAAVGDTTTEPVAPFSSRGGELAGPDIVVPGAAYSTVPNFGLGNEVENGTSMASPYAAGLAARLLSAAAATGRRAPASLIRQALRIGARALPSGSTVDQGAGLPDLERAWNWLLAPHDFVEIGVDAGTVAGRGAVLLTGAPLGAPVLPLGARITLRLLDGTGPLTLRLICGAGWLRIPETVTLSGGRGEFTLGVAPESMRSPGMLSATIRVEGPDETAGPLAMIPVTVRIPVPAGGTRAPIDLHQEPGSVGRVFALADTGRGMQIEIATLRAGERVAASLHEPGGMPFRDNHTIRAGFGGEAGMFDIDARDVSTGLYELAVVAGPDARADARVTVRQSPVRLGAVYQRDTLRVTARNLVATSLSVRLRAGLIGGERQLTVTGNGSAPIRLTVPVPVWAARAAVDTRMPRAEWSRFTDFGLSFLDRHGRFLSSSPINYAFSRAEPTLPESVIGDTLVVLLSPAFADAGHQGTWTLELSVRFYVETPYSLDAGGSAVKPIAGGALREERFRPGSAPIVFPPHFMPLATIVALEGTEHIWTREVALKRLPGMPP